MFRCWCRFWLRTLLSLYSTIKKTRQNLYISSCCRNSSAVSEKFSRLLLGLELGSAALTAHPRAAVRRLQRPLAVIHGQHDRYFVFAQNPLKVIIIILSWPLSKVFPNYHISSYSPVYIRSFVTPLVRWAEFYFASVLKKLKVILKTDDINFQKAIFRKNQEVCIYKYFKQVPTFPYRQSKIYFTLSENAKSVSFMNGKDKNLQPSGLNGKLQNIRL